MQIVKETEGVIGIRRLQNKEWKIWTKEEVESSGLSYNAKKVLYFVGKKNSYRKILRRNEIGKELSLSDNFLKHSLKEIKEEEMAFNFSAVDVIEVYGLKYLGHKRGRWNPPEHLEWFVLYLKHVGGKRGGILSWDEKIKSSGRYAYRHYWLALLEIDGEVCYQPLGLHIPKPEPLSV